MEQCTLGQCGVHETVQYVAMQACLRCHMPHDCALLDVPRMSSLSWIWVPRGLDVDTMVAGELGFTQPPLTP